MPVPGDVLGRGYVLGEQLGCGGMGIVFRASRPDLDRDVAVKVMRGELVRNPTLVAQFRNEAVIAGRVDHPGVVSVLDRGGLAEGLPYFVMERVHGAPLGRIVVQQTLPVRRALAILDQLLDAVAAIHDRDVIHGDLKSDNVLVDTERGDRVTVIDFGLARSSDQPRVTGRVSGTPEYMAPELGSGGITSIASDLYAVAVVAYELLTGATPFTGTTPAEVLARHANDVVVPASLRRRDGDVSRELDDVVCRGLAKRPERRFATAAELAAALRTAGRRYRPCPVQTTSPRDAAVDWHAARTEPNSPSAC